MPRIRPDDALKDQHLDSADDPFGLGSYDSVLFSDTGGLTQFGAFLETLHPGSQSSRQHWHENEDEFIYVISGEVVLLEDDQETLLVPGDAATFKAGTPVAHCLHNKSEVPATYLVVGARAERDIIRYRDDGTMIERTGRRRVVKDAQGALVREYER